MLPLGEELHYLMLPFPKKKKKSCEVVRSSRLSVSEMVQIKVLREQSVLEGQGGRLGNTWFMVDIA